ncbi:hypothetical protein ACWAT4_27460 [Bradyrhizobium manausense]
MGQSYDGKTINLTVEPHNGGYVWVLELSGQSSDGQAKLGYRAQGSAHDFDQEKFLIQVHDKDRAVWTAMPLDHRKDIRKTMSQLVQAALLSLSELKHA